MVSRRLSYPGSLSGNKIGDGGAGTVAAAAGTMPCLETLEWVIVHFPFFPLSHQLLPLLEGHIHRHMSCTCSKLTEISAQSPFLILEWLTFC